MKYSERLEKAIRTAGRLHRDQYRKGVTRLPYVTHPFSVAMIVSNFTDDEDIIIAALLHDTFEDTNYKEDEMVDQFGTRVRDIVLGVTEPSEATSWEEKKKGYILGLKSASAESLLVAAADKKHNLSSVLKDYKKNPSSFFKEFSGSIDERIGYYEKMVEIIIGNLDSPITEDLEKIFKEYKNFLLQIK